MVNYSGKIEMGFLKFSGRLIKIDPGPGWKGYNLDDKQNGIDMNIVNGISLLKKKVFVGVGFGYLNFEGINGYSLFSDFEYIPLTKRLSPLLNLKIGYAHIWNQYLDGKSTGLTEFGIGVNYFITGKYSIYLKTGLLFTQQSHLTPIRIGFRF